MPTNHPFLDAIRVVAGSCSQQSPGTAQFQTPEFRATADVTRVDTLAAELLNLRFEIPGTNHWSLPQLRRQAKSLAERVQYLLEPLSVIETDEDSATVQLRSTQPAQLDQARAYYEVLARPGSLHLCRYITQSSAARRPTAMQLTYEQLDRLLADVTAVVSDDA